MSSYQIAWNGMFHLFKDDFFVCLVIFILQSIYCTYVSNQQWLEFVFGSKLSSELHNSHIAQIKFCLSQRFKIFPCTLQTCHFVLPK